MSNKPATVRKPTVRYIDLHDGTCALSTDSEAAIMRHEGARNVRMIRNATQADVDWIEAMGGRVPTGRIQEAKP